MSSLLTCSSSQPNFDFSDRHHILFIRRSWQGSEWADKLRDLECTQAIIPRSLHNAIHKTVRKGVPIPSEETCRTTYTHILDLRQDPSLYPASITTRLQLLITIWGVDSNNPALNAVIRQLEVVDNYFNTT